MRRTLLISTLCGTLLTGLFWTKLWRGGGLIGGDTYTYFLPQKAFLADRLQAGEFPLWNHWTGHGYPLIGESQTAALYPPNVLLYGTLDLNTAYVASHLLHYVLAFVGVWVLARRFELNDWGAALAALVYVYGWFPPRSCLEWAIVGGVYLPWSLWCLESYLQLGRRRYAVGLSVLLGLDLLAGHFNLAFITTVGLAAYGALRVGWRNRNAIATSDGSGEARPNLHRLGIAAICIALGFGIAAPQLVPSWDLKQASQRTKINEEFDPGYGHIPPWYLSQVATPWLWFAADTNADQALNSITVGSIPSGTNKVEAHLYFGLLPLLLMFLWLVRGVILRSPADRRLWIMAWIGLAAMIYATGWLLPVARQLPGFSFFRGPGRWGLLTTLAAALIGGSLLSDLTAVGRWGWVRLSAIVILATTAADLHWVGRHPWYTYSVRDPAILHVDESPVGQELAEFARDHGPPRMLSPGPNLANLVGQSATPPYLGFGPDAYYLDGGRLPDTRFLQFLSGDQTPTDVDIDTQFTWLRNAGVTHILSMKRLPSVWPVDELWRGFDRLLSAGWMRWTEQEPLYLYAIHAAPGRIFLDPPTAGSSVRLTTYFANRVTAEVNSDSPTTVVLTDLPWPEWEVSVDGARPPATTNESPTASKLAATAFPVQRRVHVPAGSHTVVWIYNPRSLRWGIGLSLASAIGLVVIARRAHRPSNES